MDQKYFPPFSLTGLLIYVLLYQSLHFGTKNVDEEQKFSHLKPGVISENLGNALGLRKDELPSYIYGMRALGYPPGWLEEARIVHSSLRMFDIDGEKVEENKEKRKRGLDPDKKVSYPGFNAPMEKGFYDVSFYIERQKDFGC